MKQGFLFLHCGRSFPLKKKQPIIVVFHIQGHFLPFCQLLQKPFSVRKRSLSLLPIFNYTVHGLICSCCLLSNKNPASSKERSFSLIGHSENGVETIEQSFEIDLIECFDNAVFHFIRFTHTFCLLYLVVQFLN